MGPPEPYGGENPLGPEPIRKDNQISGEGELQKGESVQAFMESMTNFIERGPWESAELIQRFGGTKDAADDFADLFWSLLISDSSVLRSVMRGQSFPSPGGLRRASYFIVGFTSPAGYQRDLLVFVPELFDRKIVASAAFDSKWDALKNLAAQMKNTYQVSTDSHGSRLHDMMRFIAETSRSEGGRSFDDFVRQSRPAIVVIPHPQVNLHAGVPSPALLAGPSPKAQFSSTVGVLTTNVAGDDGLTMAYHALKNGSTRGYVGQLVNINGKEGKVISIDEVSDSAFVRVDGGTETIPKRSFSCIRQSPAPGYGQTASFDCRNRGRISTVIFSSPPTLLLNHPALQRQFLTQPDSLPGDSGCALIDDTDQLVGFCFGGSGVASPLLFSIWIWADSVFQANQLRR